MQCCYMGVARLVGVAKLLDGRGGVCVIQAVESVTRYF